MGAAGAAIRGAHPFKDPATILRIVSLMLVLGEVLGLKVLSA